MTAQRRRAFVIGAYIPRGGTYMSYHLGHILHHDFGFQMIAVQIGKEAADNGILSYDPKFPSITVAGMEAEINDDDVLVCNPSYSAYMFGLRLPGRKLCYVQGFNTFKVLDRGFDAYVAVSDVVRRYLSAVYDLSPPIIPPFVDLAGTPVAQSWWARPPGSILVYAKDNAAAAPIIERIRAILSSRAPDIALDSFITGVALPQAEFMQRLGRYRHLLNLSIAEGFGLVSLEAMAMGTTVLGFDGFGGRDYMQPGINCAVAAYPDIEAVTDHLIAVIRAPELGARFADVGRATAERYGYDRFRSAWVDELGRFLEMPPIRRRTSA